MPETNPAVTPDLTPEPSQTTDVTSKSEPSTTTPRSEIYKKYYGNEPPVEPAVSPQDSPAQDESPKTESSTSSLPPELTERFTVLESTVGQIAEALKNLIPKAPEKPPESVSEPPNWIELLRAGKQEEGEEALANKLLSRIEKHVIPKAVELGHVDDEIKTFITDLRGKNPDLLPFEEFISIKAQQKIQEAINKNEVTNPTKFVEAYKTAVNASADEARKLIQTIRAAGKTEALETKKTVLSASPIAPSAIDTDRGVSDKSKPTEPETATDYIARRQELLNRSRGMVHKAQ